MTDRRDPVTEFYDSQAYLMPRAWPAWDGEEWGRLIAQGVRLAREAGLCPPRAPAPVPVVTLVLLPHAMSAEDVKPVADGLREEFGTNNEFGAWIDTWFEAAIQCSDDLPAALDRIAAVAAMLALEGAPSITLLMYGARSAETVAMLLEVHGVATRTLHGADVLEHRADRFVDGLPRRGLGLNFDHLRSWWADAGTVVQPVGDRGDA